MRQRQEVGELFLRRQKSHGLSQSFVETTLDVSEVTGGVLRWKTGEGMHY